MGVARWYDLDGEIRSFEPRYDPPPEPMIEWEIYDLSKNSKVNNDRTNVPIYRYF